MILLGKVHAWAESIKYAVAHEINGEVAHGLPKDFGVIPSTVEQEPEE